MVAPVFWADGQRRARVQRGRAAGADAVRAGHVRAGARAHGPRGRRLPGGPGLRVQQLHAARAAARARAERAVVAAPGARSSSASRAQGRGRDAAALAAALALQALSGTYYLAYSALLLAALDASRRTRERGACRRAASAALALAGALVVVAAVLLPFVWPYLRAVPRRWGSRRSWAAGADLLAYVDPRRTRPWPWPRCPASRASCRTSSGSSAAAGGGGGARATARIAPGRAAGGGLAGRARPRWWRCCSRWVPLVRVGGAAAWARDPTRSCTAWSRRRAAWRAPSASACW